ncbi:unnamed protein product, partial [Ectocarpus fasciculatus]
LQTSAAATGVADSALPVRCSHAEVVFEAERSLTPIPAADPLFWAEEFRQALSTVPRGTFNESTTRAMHTRADQAAQEGVPVIVGLGNTKYFGIKDGHENNRTVIGEWAHVKYEDKGGSKMFQCKLDGGMDGMEFGPKGGVWGDEDSTGDDVGFASSTQRTDPIRFRQQMAQLRLICSVYKCPVDEPEFKEGTYGRDTIHIKGCICTGCGNPYEQLPDADGILLGQAAGGAELRVVKLERRECRVCNLRGWAGDDIYEDGVFNFNNNVVIEVRLLYDIRRAFSSGTPISTWIKTFLAPLGDSLAWLDASESNRILASR